MRALVVTSLVGLALWSPRARAGGAPTPAPAQAAPSADVWAVAAVEIAGDADPQLRPQIAAAVMRGLDRAGVSHVEGDVVAQALRARPELVGCMTTTCLEKLASMVGAARFVSARVETAGAAYSVELTTLTTDGPAARKKASCEVCTMSELGDLITAKTAALVTSPTGAVAVTFATRPGGAEVAVVPPGEPGALQQVVKTPQSINLAPGTYQVEVKLAGYAVLRQTITVADSDEPQTFELALSRGASDTGGRPRFGLLKWIATGTGAVALGGAILAFARDGSDACSSAPCPKVYESSAEAFALTGLALVAGGAAGWMFWHDAHAGRSAHVAVLPTTTGVRASVSLSF
ncbi:MAG: PEGA domain-containing protein [Deltaproteobacteria bacterium]|nr:PEGA domain-containing protein [Deltaproteobacteria bacterium]